MAATALCGMVVVQALNSAAKSEAIKYQNEFEGVFDKETLWLGGGANGNNTPQYVKTPWAVSGTTIASQTKVGYDKSVADGSPNTCTGAWQNLAMGPLLIHQGDTRLAQIGWASGGGSGAVVFTGDKGCYQTSGDFAPGAGATWGGEVNQTTGELYTIRAAEETFSGGTSGDNPEFWIFRVVNSGTSAAPSLSLEASPAHSSTATPPAGGSLNEEAAAARKSVSGSWGLGSDMAIDANGNAYRMARNGSVWALVRFTVPRDPATGKVLSSDWSYEVVRIFENRTAGAVWGMAFMNGDLYTSHSNYQMYRWDPLAGTSVPLGQPFAGILDLAAAQVAPVIEGTVYIDRNGDGHIDEDESEAGLGGVVIDIWEQKTPSAAPELRGVMTTNASGNYSALLPSASSVFYLRPHPPVADGANAGQSYASAGQYTEIGAQAPNVVTPLCRTTQGDYQPMTTSGECRGARNDGIDPEHVDNPIDPVHGANVVTKVTMGTDHAVVTADFGVSYAGSWGDAPAAYKSTNEEGGPYGDPGTLRLGSESAYYEDGRSPGPGGATMPDGFYDPHAATDDGLWYAVKRAGQTYDQYSELDWYPASRGMLTVGETYVFRAKVEGTLASTGVAKAWLAPYSGGTYSTTFSQQLLNGTPGTGGYVYGEYTAAVDPITDSTPMYIRARVSQDPNVDPLSRGVPNTETESWVPKGEIEDHPISATSATIRMRVRSTAGVETNVFAQALNLRTQPPFATDSFSVKVPADGAYVRPAQAHAVHSLGQSVRWTLVRVGSPGVQPDLGGYKILPDQVSCFKTGTNDEVDITATETTIAIEPAGQTTPVWRDLTCDVTIGAALTEQYSELTVAPVPDPANPKSPGSGGYLATITGMAHLRDFDGEWQTRPVANAPVTFTLAPAGSGAAANGAFFEESQAQTYTCTLNTQGQCSTVIDATVRGTYRITATGESGAATLGTALVYFAEGTGAELHSQATVSQTAGQLANRATDGVAPADWGVQTITVTVKDQDQHPVTDAANVLSVRAADHDTFAGQGLYFDNDGAFVCQVAQVDGGCPTGTYVLKVYSEFAGDRLLIASYQRGAPSGFDITNGADASTKVLSAPFTAPPVSGSSSTLMVSPSDPVDDPSDPNDDPDGTPTVLEVGQQYSVWVTAWDAGRHNRLGGQSVTLTLSGAGCAASFADGTTTRTATTSAAGQVADQVTGVADSNCTLTATVAGQAVGGSPKLLDWDDRNVNPGDPRTWFSVSEAEVVANGTDTGEIRVQLYGTNGYPVTTRAGALSGSGPADGEITVSGFRHIGDGIYTATFSGTKADDKLITVTYTNPDTGQATSLNVRVVNGTALNDTAHMVPGPPFSGPGRTRLESPRAPAQATGSDPQRVRAYVTDEGGNVIRQRDVYFSVPAGTRVLGGVSGQATVRIATNDDGIADLILVSDNLGRFNVTAEVDSTPARVSITEGSPAVVEFTNSEFRPGSSLFRIATAPERKEVDREFHTAVAELLDSDGHHYQPVVEVTFRYREASETNWSYSQPVPTDGGIATWTEFTVTKAGVYEVEAWTTAGQVGTTQRAEFKPGDVSVEHTLASLEVSRSAAFANGRATVEAVMTARDRFDNSIPGVTLGFETLHEVPFGAIFAGSGTKTIQDVSGADGKVR
ncbi:MAG: hypothetical protein LBH68_04430, partial [Bifidobacteriaceae bacterium]|nr:hypothetical protein [Bifidobacteriaceae bacterium]